MHIPTLPICQLAYAARGLAIVGFCYLFSFSFERKKVRTAKFEPATVASSQNESHGLPFCGSRLAQAPPVHITLAVHFSVFFFFFFFLRYLCQWAYLQMPPLESLLLNCIRGDTCTKLRHLYWTCQSTVFNWARLPLICTRRRKLNCERLWNEKILLQSSVRK